MTVTQLKVALCKLGVEKSEYRCLKKLILQAMLNYQLQSIRTKTNQNVEDSVCQVILSKGIIRPSSLCFTKNDILAVSTLLGEVILIKILCDFINISGEVIQLIELPFKSIQSSISCGNRFLVSGNAAPGGILRFSLTDGGMTDCAASELLKNETMHVSCVQCMAIWNTAREDILFTDSLQGSIGVLDTKSGNTEIFAGKPRNENQEIIEHDGCDGFFAQPTGICVEWNTVIVVDSAAKKLKIVVSSSGLNKYLYHLHNFCLLFGIHRKSKKPEIKSIYQIIIGLQEVYEFDKVCVNNVRRYYGLNDEASTQGPHGTVSNVVVKDYERILYGLRNLRKAFKDLCPRLLETFDIKSILTLC